VMPLHIYIRWDSASLIPQNLSTFAFYAVYYSCQAELVI
jgi:hypothetical protein